MNFYPRPPRGGRLSFCAVAGLRLLFLSTPSARRATSSLLPVITPLLISIHALREEGDGTVVDSQALLFYFYPRPPRGGRQSVRRTYLWERDISIHALREEGDKSRSPFTNPSRNFYPRPPRGGRLFGADFIQVDV